MSVVDEGFICPYCLVRFATSGKLQAHFVDMHSSGVDSADEPQDVAAAAGYEQLGQEEESVDGVLGHQFVQRRMHKPTSCSACEEIIWQDGIACLRCSVVLHVDGCRKKLTVQCSETSDSPNYTEQNAIRRSAGPQQPAKGPLALVRRQIAKGRDRYVSDEFDLDLTYITERIIAMSFPATGMESTYRNSLKDVAKMLEIKHQENYMIFNLSERSYDISRFNNQVLDFGWPDHLAPSLERLSSVCRSMKAWLDTDPQHVVVVHCKGGKGRTGCVIAAFMNYSEICQSAEAALDRFAMKRFYDSKCAGVTQPSQRKYVHYFSDLLSGKISLKSPPVVLNHVIIHGIPNFDGKGGCRVFLKVYINMKLELTTGLHVSDEKEERIKITLHGGGLNLQGEVLLKCFHKKSHSGMESVFRCQFHTAIVKNSLRLVLKKDDLDDAFKDKKFPESAKVEFLFGVNCDSSSQVTKEEVDVRSSLLETNGATNHGEILKHESLLKRDSYANFEGGFDSGTPDTVPDLILFSPPVSHRQEGPKPIPATRKGGRDRSESTESFHMDPKAIERVTLPGCEEVYTVVNKAAAGINSKPQIVQSVYKPDKGPLTMVTPSLDPPYVNQDVLPSKAAPITYRKRTKMDSVNPKPQSKSIPLLKAANPPPPSLPTLEVDYDEVPEEEDDEVTKQGSHVRGNSTSTSEDSRTPVSQKKALVPSGKKQSSYDEISFDQQMRLQPVTPRLSGHDSDPGWCKFKFQTLPSNCGDSSHHSSSSSNPTIGSNFGEMYSNLGDIIVGGGFVGESQRRHSFTEGDELIVIHGTRDSLTTGGRASKRAEYKNLNPTNPTVSGGGVGEHNAAVAGQEEALYTNPERLVEELNLEVQKGSKQLPTAYYNIAVQVQKKAAVPLLPPPSSSGEGDDGEDYMNEEPEGVFHIYSNQKELLAQLQADNNPVPDPAPQTTDTSAVPGGEKKITVMFKNIMSKTPFVKKPPNEIHSQKITETDRQKTLQPFALSGNAQAGRDYEAFFKTSAWGAGGQRQKPSSIIPELSRVPPPKPEKPTTGLTPSPIRLPQPLVSPDGRKPVPLLPKPFTPSAAPSTVNTPTSAAHVMVGPTRSVDLPPPPHSRSSRPTLPRATRDDKSTTRSTDNGGPIVPKPRPPPPRPPPYIPDRNQPKLPSDNVVRSLMPYWYQPNITREEAITLVRQMNSGAFIVRDSQTVSGGYALTIKVREAIVRQRKKLGDGAKITEDMCVTHFLIQPDPEGVKLQGWNERAFKSLAEFIAHHTVEKICLPCKLVLPNQGGREGGRGQMVYGRVRNSGRGDDSGEGAALPQLRRRPVTMEEALKTGAACDLVYLGSVDVSGPGSEVMLAETIKQRKSLDISVSVVTFKAAKEGITISDNVSGLYIKRQYPISSLTYCGADPNDTRWDFPQLQHLGEATPITNAPCFGVFTRLPDNGGHSCLLFAQYSTTQPVTSVLSYIHQVMRQRQSHI